jgi:spore coat protein U-like protein
MVGQHEPSVLSYNLHVDPARSIIWGDGSGSSAAITGLIAFPLTTAVARRVDFTDAFRRARMSVRSRIRTRSSSR